MIKEKRHYLYRITNIKNNKIYIGQTVNPNERWYMHKRAALNPEYSIQFAIKKYGEENFVFEVIASGILSCSCIPNVKTQCQIEADDLETQLIAQYDSYKNGYNETLGGMTSPRSGEFKKKLSIANAGENNPFFGRKHTPESIEKMRIAHTGIKPTEETRIKLSEIHKGEKNHFFGKTHSPESLEKMRQANIGKTISKETRKKISIANTGKKKQGHSAWNKGKSIFPIDKIIEARIAGATYPELVRMFNINLSCLSKIFRDTPYGRKYIPRVPWNKKNK